MKRIYTITIAAMVLLFNCKTFAQTIETIIGTGTAASGFTLNSNGSEELISGLTTKLRTSGSMCSDAAGNIYFVDRNNSYVRKWNASTKQVLTVAGVGNTLASSFGTANSGSSPGDGGLAVGTPISCNSICVTSDGHYLFIAENSYYRIRVVNLQTNVISTVVGYSSQPSAVYCGGTVVRDGGTAKFACVSPTGNKSLTIDADNNLYVWDIASNSRIRKIAANPTTGIADGNSVISTVAFGYGLATEGYDGVSGYGVTGTGAGGCSAVTGKGYLGSNSAPSLIAKNGFIYFTEIYNFSNVQHIKVRTLEPTTNIIATLVDYSNPTASGGSGTPSVNTSDFAIDYNNNFYFTDAFTNEIYKITPQSLNNGTPTTFSVVSGNKPIASSCYSPKILGTRFGILDSACFSFTAGIGALCSDANGNLYVGDPGHYMIDKISFCTLPDVAAITGTTFSCNLSSSNILHDEVGGGVWGNSDPTVATMQQITPTTVKITPTAPLKVGSTTISYARLAAGACPVSSASVVYNVAPVIVPAITAGSGNSVCKNSTLQLSNTLVGGVWTSVSPLYASINSAGLITGINAGNASFVYTVTNSFGCTGSSSPFPVTVNSNLIVPSIAYAVGSSNPQNGAGGGSNYCNNRTFTLVGTPTGGTWSSAGGVTVDATTGVVSTTTLGTASVTYTFTNASNCKSSKTIAGIIVPCLGHRGDVGSNEQLASNNDFTIYPNPARTFMSLNVNKLIGSGAIVVTDLYGKQVKVQPLSMGGNTVDVSSLTKGFYLVSVLTNEGKITKKLVVE